MAVIQERDEFRRDLGPPAAVAYLNSWLDERAGMNKALMDAEMETPDIARLADAEVRLRASIQDLMTSRIQASSGQHRDTANLSIAAIRAWASINVAGVQESGATTRSKIAAQVDVERIRQDANVLRAEELQAPAEHLPVLDNIYASKARSENAVGRSLVESPAGIGTAIDAVLGDAGHPAPHTRQRDAIVTRAIQAAEEAGDQDAAQAIADRYGIAGMPWATYMDRTHPAYTKEDAKEALSGINRLSSGANPDAIFAAVSTIASKFGGIGGGESSRTSSGGTVPIDSAGIDKLLEGMEAAADDLAKQRKEATKPRIFPRSNYVITNPNQYTNPRQMRSLRAWGGLDAPYVREVQESAEMEGGYRGAVRAIGEREGLSQAPLVADQPVESYMDDRDPVVDAIASKMGPPFSGEGGWTYILNGDGSITRAKAGFTGTADVKPGSAEHAAIVGEVFADLGKGPVADLYAPVLARLAAGQWGKAIESARGLESDARALWGGLLQSGDAGAIEAALPYAPPKVRERVTAILGVAVRNRFDARRQGAGLEAAGRALIGVDDAKERERVKEKGEARQTAAMKQGLDLPADTDVEKGALAGREMAAQLREQSTDDADYERRVKAQAAVLKPNRSEFERAMVGALTAAAPVPKAELRAGMKPMPEISVRRPSDREPLSIGGRSSGGTVRGVDLDLEPAELVQEAKGEAVAEDEYDEAAFMLTLKPPAAEAEAEYDEAAFMATLPGAKK